MPVVTVARDRLFVAIGKSYSEAEFEELCFDYGIELDDVTTQEEILRKQHQTTEDAASDATEEVLYKIDVPANRYDMLCMEGIARALNIFLGRISTVNYTISPASGEHRQQLTVKPETALVRPFMVCAVLRGISFDSVSYKGFIELQDKLHQNLCRQRSLVSIGTHDLALIQGPFTYEALHPEDIVFTPLKQTREFNARELLQHYLEHDQRLRRFVPIIQSSMLYPVVLDANRTVLSLPPIINGSASAMSEHTKDIFIEVTATDLTKAQIVLNTLTTMFSEYCAVPFEVEPVEVVDAHGTEHVYPDLSSWQMEVGVDYINGCTGLDLSAEQISRLLSRMALSSRPSDTGGSVHVSVPPTRSDVLHSCDVMEDVAIAHGYNNIPRRLPPSATLGGEQAINQLTDLLRAECAMAGFTEILTWALCSRAENFGGLLLQDSPTAAVGIGNPATVEFEVCRTSLLPGILKTMGASKDSPLPVRLFEISDVVLLSDESDTGAVNCRRLAALQCGKTSGFEVILGLLNRVMESLGVPLGGGLADLQGHTVRKPKCSYEWQESRQPVFFPGRQADILADGHRVGSFGVVHPDVLRKFDIPAPVSALELDLEPFCYDQDNQALTTHLVMQEL